jgi:hypothetical protein
MANMHVDYQNRSASLVPLQEENKALITNIISTTAICPRASTRNTMEDHKTMLQLHSKQNIFAHGQHSHAVGYSRPCGTRGLQGSFWWYPWGDE